MDPQFEYLIKYARLTNTNDNLFADTWHTAVDSSIKHLLRVRYYFYFLLFLLPIRVLLVLIPYLQNSTVGNHLYLADFDGTSIRHVGSHLACFYAGNWMFGACAC